MFAKLREAHSEVDAGSPEPEPVVEEPEAEPEPVVEELVPEDLVVVAVQKAVAVASRALKKVVVDEQGTLLDGVRRSGAEAISPVVDADGACDPYDEAIRPALLDFAAELGAPIGIDLDAVLDLVASIVVQPVHQRLREVAEATDDPDELSDTVRGLYRESRSRRVPEAADAVVSAVHGLVVIAVATGQVRWVCAPEGSCGPDCADNELQGLVDAGQRFPTGHAHPPAHPTCTCRLAAAD